ncbi:hypothetical protein CEUSTIGMA_g12355.t1 [Chlamydomonas eustigma]|uniref:Uncharacterized protein n=1 Tax=Chlamydomonas eustigma TaxID=1157962 RepID=A0A250XPC4_9CHLO|nr:hypothetical protein CEUSTIGMA_g12355.t1 [Chlamydomonas eustigma]|eukprot:GAX84934.1 hypothetical protein CEUSTIGMA_g12355.t1 [Chlamydomonas eustigma]
MSTKVPGPPTSYILKVPQLVIQNAKDFYKCKQSTDDWHQCDIVDCGRWYRRCRQVATEIRARVKLDAQGRATMSVSVVELRWACPFCSNSWHGKDLSISDSFLGTTKPNRQFDPCDWCKDQGLTKCNSTEHDKSEWDADEENDYKASGVQLPPNCAAGFRTRSPDLTPYKILIFFCSACGDILSSDRCAKFIQHMNNRGPEAYSPAAPAADGGSMMMMVKNSMMMSANRNAAAHVPASSNAGLQRMCIVPEFQKLLRHQPGCGREQLDPPLDPMLVRDLIVCLCTAYLPPLLLTHN